MPTPTGLLAKGDVIEYTTNGTLLVVTARQGSGKSYSVTVTRQDGQPFPTSGAELIIPDVPANLDNGKLKLV